MARCMGQATQDRLARTVPGASAVLDMVVQTKMQTKKLGNDAVQA